MLVNIVLSLWPSTHIQRKLRGNGVFFGGGGSGMGIESWYAGAL